MLETFLFSRPGLETFDIRLVAARERFDRDQTLQVEVPGLVNGPECLRGASGSRRPPPSGRPARYRFSSELVTASKAGSYPASRRPCARMKRSMSDSIRTRFVPRSTNTSAAGSSAWTAEVTTFTQ